MRIDELIDRLPDVVQRHWSRTPSSIAPMGGGMGSATAVLEIDSGRYVAKWVPAEARNALLDGAVAARDLAAAGLITGPPLPSSTGELEVAVDDGFLLLLQFVPGRPLTGHSPDEQTIIADLLSATHTAQPLGTRRAPFFTWLGDAPAVRRVADWLPDTIIDVLAEYAALPPVTWGTLHTDPAPEAFLHDDATGRTGLIDWTGSTEGPLLYDVASAVMYLGGEDAALPFLRRYAGSGAMPAGELQDHLDVFRRFRGIVQADYFARRVLAEDLTGIEDQSENWQGLADGRRMSTRRRNEPLFLADQA